MLKITLVDKKLKEQPDGFRYHKESTFSTENFNYLTNKFDDEDDNDNSDSDNDEAKDNEELFSITKSMNQIEMIKDIKKLSGPLKRQFFNVVMNDEDISRDTLNDLWKTYIDWTQFYIQNYKTGEQIGKINENIGNSESMNLYLELSRVHCILFKKYNTDRENGNKIKPFWLMKDNITNGDKKSLWKLPLMDEVGSVELDGLPRRLFLYPKKYILEYTIVEIIKSFIRFIQNIHLLADITSSKINVIQLHYYVHLLLFRTGVILHMLWGEEIFNGKKLKKKGSKLFSTYLCPHVLSKNGIIYRANRSLIYFASHCFYMFHCMFQTDKYIMASPTYNLVAIDNREKTCIQFTDWILAYLSNYFSNERSPMQNLTMKGFNNAVALALVGGLVDLNAFVTEIDMKNYFTDQANQNERNLKVLLKYQVITHDILELFLNRFNKQYKEGNAAGLFDLFFTRFMTGHLLKKDLFTKVFLQDKKRNPLFPKNIRDEMTKKPGLIDSYIYAIYVIECNLYLESINRWFDLETMISNWKGQYVYTHTRVLEASEKVINNIKFSKDPIIVQLGPVDYCVMREGKIKIRSSDIRLVIYTWFLICVAECNFTLVNGKIKVNIRDYVIKMPFFESKIKKTEKEIKKEEHRELMKKYDSLFSEKKEGDDDSGESSNDEDIEIGFGEQLNKKELINEKKDEYVSIATLLGESEYNKTTHAIDKEEAIDQWRRDREKVKKKKKEKKKDLTKKINEIHELLTEKKKKKEPVRPKTIEETNEKFYDF